MKKLLITFLMLVLALSLAVSASAAYYVGQHVFMGEYEQDNNPYNGREAIEWRVLARSGSEVLLISEYGLDCVLYNYTNESTYWANCSVRSWLNNSFFYSAFDSSERNAIVNTYVYNDSSEQAYYHDGGNTTGGPNTYDRIFLLSYAETQRYFSGNADRRCYATRYANAMGAFNKGGYTYWLTRSPGYKQMFVTIINSQGERHGSNTRVDNNGKNNGVVRPAMWVDTSTGVLR